VAGVFRSRNALEAAVGELLLSAFDRADVDVTTPDAAREKCGFEIPALELPEAPEAPRRYSFTRSTTATGDVMRASRD
jgi:hypothetical protein